MPHGLITMAKEYTKVVVNGKESCEIKEIVENRTLITLEEIDRKISQLQSALTMLQAEREQIASAMTK